MRISFWYGGVEYRESPMGTGFVDVVNVEPTGGVMGGTFEGTLTPSTSTDGPQVLNIKGKFRVCHGTDYATI